MIFRGVREKIHKSSFGRWCNVPSDFFVMSAADTKVTVVRGSGALVASVVGRTSIGELTANCEHGDEIDRGEFDIGPAGKAIRWRVVFCDPCWEYFRHHQEVIDLQYF